MENARSRGQRDRATGCSSIGNGAKHRPECQSFSIRPPAFSIRRAYNRAVKIYTKTGDRGETALLGGARVRRADARVSAYGEVDELGAWLGFVRATGAGE